MKKMIFAIFTAVLMTISCSVKEAEPQTAEEINKEAIEGVTTLEAFMDNETKTAYEINSEGTKAIFAWAAGDEIDAAILQGGVYSPIRFVAQAGGASTTFSDATSSPKVSDFDAAALTDIAFYPSRLCESAQEAGFNIDWSIRDKFYDEDIAAYPDDDLIITVDLPSEITMPVGNPLSTIPMIGKRTAPGTYGFVPLTGVLAVPVQNMPDGIDYASIESDDAAISGSFHVNRNGNYISQTSCLSNTGKGLKLKFSNLGENYTFYFPIAAGTIPAGLKITVGNSSDPDNKMVLTTQRALQITNGRIAQSLPVVFAVEDQQWADYMEGSFLDDFIWGQRSWDASTYVSVMIQRSGLHPERYRIANPYTTAATTFGYTPATAGIATGEWFCFSIDGDAVTFNALDTGIEDSQSRPLAVNYRPSMAQYTHIVDQLADGSPIEVQFAGYYTISGNYYTKDNFDGSPKIHLFFDQPEKWFEVADGEFIDDLLWGNHGWGTTRVPVKLLQSTMDATKYRIANPYLKAAEQFNYSTYTSGITGAEYVEISMLDNDLLRFATFYAGIEDKPSGGKPMKIWYPTDWGAAYDASYNKVLSWRSDGFPEEMQFAAFYSDINPSNYGYKYTKYNVPTIHFYFPETDSETWTSVGTVQFKDDFWVSNRLGKGTNRYVDVTLEQSDLDSKRFRIANPYSALATLVGASDTYLYPGNESPYIIMTVADDGTVTYDEFRPGVGDSSKELAICHPAEWNTLSGDNKTANLSAVSSFLPNGLPYEIKLYAMYHEVGNYINSSTSGNHLYSRDTAANGDVIVIKFPDTWNSIGTGMYKDKLVWECAGLTDYAQVEFQQHAYKSNNFRIAKPYPGTNSDEWFVFDVTDPDNVTSEKYYLDYEVTASGKASFKPYIWTGYYSTDYSKVLITQDNGLPSVVELGPCYRGDSFLPSYDYNYEIGRNHEMLAIEIVFPGCETYAIQTFKAKVTHYQNGLKSEFHNPVAKLELPSGTLQRLVIKIGGDLSNVTGLRLWQDNIGGWMNSEYVAPDSEGVVTINTFSNATISGRIDLNFWLTGSVVGSAFTFDIQEVVVDGASIPIVQDNSIVHLGGIVVNNGGDQEVVRGALTTISSFRIPALVTSNAGTLIGAYDVRYDHSGDLQADISVGVKRSTDGGKTWSDLIIAMDMGITGYETEVAAGTMTEKTARLNNGIGDPCLLVDENTGRLFCFAVWTHGHYSDADHRSLAYAGKGFNINDTPQFMMVYSDDDGITWSEPVNITRQIKKYDWRMTFQGPGRGITMKDGTLVIPIQHQEGETKIMHGLYPLNSGIAYSTDHGVTWHAHEFAHPVTSECTVAEIEPGVLMLSMRDETDSHYRRNYVTRDLGRTWNAHSSNGKWLDATCEASMIHVDASKNILGKDLLIFSNPHNTERSRMTIHVSQDRGESFSHTLMVDSGGSLGYSCLSMIDNETVGILYESSRGSIYFQAVPLTAIVK